MALTPLTTEAKVKELLSEVGADLHTDDLASDTAFYTTICLTATEWIFSYTIAQYDNDQAGNSTYLAHYATIVAAHLLYMRRGNGDASPFQAEIEMFKERLQAIADFEAHLPDVGARDSGQPVLSNILIDDRFILNKDRKDADNSIGSYPGERRLHYPLSFGDGF